MFLSKDNLKQINKYFWPRLGKTLILVASGLFFALTIESMIDQSMILNVKQNIYPPLQIIIAELIGFISPGPRYILYPVLATLHDMGVGYGIIIALISGHVLIEPSTFFVEYGFFGFRFPLKRFIAAFIVTFLAGYITQLLVN